MFPAVAVTAEELMWCCGVIVFYVDPTDTVVDVAKRDVLCCVVDLNLLTVNRHERQSVEVAIEFRVAAGATDVDLDVCVVGQLEPIRCCRLCTGVPRGVVVVVDLGPGGGSSSVER